MKLYISNHRILCIVHKFHYDCFRNKLNIQFVIELWDSPCTFEITTRKLLTSISFLNIMVSLMFMPIEHSFMLNTHFIPGYSAGIVLGYSELSKRE